MIKWSYSRGDAPAETTEWINTDGKHIWNESLLIIRSFERVYLSLFCQQYGYDNVNFDRNPIRTGKNFLCFFPYAWGVLCSIQHFHTVCEKRWSLALVQSVEQENQKHPSVSELGGLAEPRTAGFWPHPQEHRTLFLVSFKTTWTTPFMSSSSCFQLFLYLLEYLCILPYSLQHTRKQKRRTRHDGCRVKVRKCGVINMSIHTCSSCMSWLRWTWTQDENKSQMSFLCTERTRQASC